LVLLAYGLANVTYNIYKIRRIDYDGIYSELNDYLESDRGELSLKPDNDKIQIEYNYRIQDGPYKPRRIEVDFAPSPDDYVIYVYGSSPVVSRLLFSSEKSLFPFLLQSRLNLDKKGTIDVYNFGVESFDSFDLEKLIKATVKFRKPDLMIYYEGHMDYEAAYLTGIKREFYFLRGNFFRYLFGVASFKKEKAGSLEKIAEIGDWIIRSTVEPNLLNFLQKFGLVSIPPDPFTGYNRLIERYYERNIKEIIGFCGQQDLPVIFVTPIANLKVKPFGVYGITQKYYLLGLKERDYRKTITYLNKARDSEIFTCDLRAKSGLNDFLRGLDSEDVYVLDLETRLMDEKFGFDYEYFYDIGHMKPGLHRIIAAYLSDFIEEHIEF